MPFDQEDLLSEPAIRPFEPGRREALQHDDDAPRCACPACAGLVDTDKTQPAANPPAFLDAADRGDVATNGKPSKTVAEAAYQLNRTYASWNDFYVQPGVSDVENSWDDPYWGGAPSIVTFAFRSTAPGSMPDDTEGFTRFSEAQIAATLLALAAWADVANIVFVRVGEGASGDAAYSDNATMLFGNYATGAAGAAAFAYYPSMSASGGDVWMNEDYSNPVAGNYATLALIHEIGHAIGFSHPGDYNAEEGVSITYAANAEYYEDSHQYTVMSYFTENNTGGNFGPLYPATIMLDDIAAAQRTYGVNTTTRTGDTVYGFNSTADRPWFATTSNSSKLVFAVWDAGGVDTFDFSGYSQNQIITLIQGHFSNVGGLIGNVAVAIGAVIENAIGGSGADTIIGNAVANRLTGNAGSDTLTGNDGADIFVATVGGGEDTITDFSAASDRIDVSAFGGYAGAVQSGLNTIVTVAAGITFTLLNVTATALTAANFITGAPPVDPPPAGYNRVNGTGAGETLNGSAASDQIYGLGGNDLLVGNDLPDWLEGGEGNDTLNGGAGADQMIGGAGDDVYLVDDAGDVTVEAVSGGLDRVETGLASWTLAANIERLTGTSGAGQTLTGNTLGNLIQGGGGADTLNGGEGDDTLNGGAGADTLNGGAGDDVYVVDNAGDVVNEGAAGGSDAVSTTLASYTLGANLEFLVGEAATGQALTGNAGSNAITGGAGGDTISGAGGNDTLRGNGGADSFVATVGGGVDTIADFVVGTDRLDVSAFGSYQSIVQDGADTIVTVAAGVSFRLVGVTAGSVTAASFSGITGPNVITGTSANNTLTGTAVVDHIFGQAGNDTIRGGGGADQLDGGAGADKLYGEDGDDVLTGGDSGDLLDGGTGADTMSGGLSNDTYVVDNAGDVVIEGVDLSKDIVQTSLATYVLAANVETLIGTSASGQTLTGTGLANTITGAGGVDTLYGLAGIDTLTGGGGGDTLYGGADADKLYGEGGDDVLFGGDGNDLMVGGDGVDIFRGELGNDSMTGGAGADRFIVSVGGGADTITDFDITSDRIDLSAYGFYQVIAASGADTLITFATGVTLRLKGIAVASVTDAIFIGLPTGGGVTEITGTAGADILYGTGGADHIVGLAGIDTIKGGASADWIEGGSEGDKLFGDAGDDLIDGGTGNDNMQGGDGADILRGGAGNDTMGGGLGADIFEVSLANGADVIGDFEVGVDRIDATAFGAYVSIVQKLSDTIITFATGSTLKLKNITATSITDASFIGLSGSAPSAAVAPAIQKEAALSAAPEPVAPEPVWQPVELSPDVLVSDWLL